MKNFKQQLEKVLTFMRPESLAQQTLKYTGEVALLVIDVQDEFCDPSWDRGTIDFQDPFCEPNRCRGTKDTKKIATRIQSAIPPFRAAGIPVYAIYSSPDKKKDIADIGFYKFIPAAHDVLVRKNRNSAFDGSNIEDILKKDQRKLLLACGFNLNACVQETLMDARRVGFEVCLLRDLTGNDVINNPDHTPVHLKAMRERGVTIENSDTVLAQILAYKHIHRNF